MPHMGKVINEDPLLNRKQAAQYLGLSNANTLAVWDSTGRYDLKPVRIGTRMVRYRKSTLDAFLLKQQSADA